MDQNDLVEAHNPQNELNEAVDPLQCNACPKHSINIAGAKLHRASIHGKTHPFMCKECFYVFECSGDYYEHYTASHESDYQIRHKKNMQAKTPDPIPNVGNDDGKIDLQELKQRASGNMDESFMSPGISKNQPLHVVMLNCIILAISPANQDLDTSNAIKISREVNTNGERTLGILTKIDLMDKGTDVVDTSGKSLVLEILVGKDFLPHGSGIVTRQPLVLQLYKIDEGREYAEFLHQPRKRFTDFAAVRKEIADETDRERGRSSKQISTVPSHLSIYSPNGERTFGVLTKIDLMDKGTDVVDILEGKAYRLQFPWIGVVNRSQADINKSVDMIAARRRERKYFANTPEYRHLAHRMGYEHLGKMMSKHLETVIKTRVPGIQSLINKSIDELESELNLLGKPVVTDARGKLYMIMEICRIFDQIYREHLDGLCPGGDKIYNIFDNQLPAALKRLQFNKQLSMENVRKLITEADDYQPHLIAPEQGYRRLIESSLVTIKGPAEAAVDAAHIVLKELVHKAISETMELKLCPSLRVEVSHAAVDSLDRMRDESRKATLKLVDMESSYLTADFFRKLPQDIEKGGNPTHSIFDRYNDSYLRRIGTNVLAYLNMVCGSLRNSIPKSIVYCQAKQLSNLLDEDPAVMERRTALAKRLELYRSAQADIDAVAWLK